jgi:hypothetical protein
LPYILCAQFSQFSYRKNINPSIYTKYVKYNYFPWPSKFEMNVMV